jgi:subtilisin family serine protease
LLSVQQAARILSGAKGVRLIQEDIKMAKMTTYTPKYIGASGVWPQLGGAENSGDGIVIAMIDTGIDPKNPSFGSFSDQTKSPPPNFKGMCRSGDRFPPESCNGKIVGARWFARAGQATGEFNATLHYASPYDPDGHGRCVLFSFYLRFQVFFKISEELPSNPKNVCTATRRRPQLEISIHQ